MRLVTAHKVLIVAAVILAALLAGRSAFNYSSTNALADAIAAFGWLILAGGLGAYLRTFWSR